MLEIDLLAPKTDERRVWLRVGTLLDGVSTAPLHNAHIVYDKKSILFAGEGLPPRDLLNSDQKQPDHDLPQYTLLPGLTDAHTHFFLEGGELDPNKRSAYLKQTPDELLDHAKQRLEKLVRLRLMAARGAGDKDGGGRGARKP